MRDRTLEASDKKLLREAAAGPMHTYFQSLSLHQRSKKWIPKRNKYRQFCTRVYDQHFRKLAPTTPNDAHLIEYIAASAPTHTLDGWSFLARAVESALRGDQYGAIHLAYYAELRAGMGLLASTGIGVFDSRHPIVDRAGVVRKFPAKQNERVGTHKALWPMLEYWGSLRASGQLLDDLIAPEGLQLTAWLTATGVPVPARAIAIKWMKSWGLDLREAETDRDRRNFVSYRPFEFRVPTSIAHDDVLSFVEDLWRLLEPSQGTSASRFGKLELELLRAARVSATAPPAAVPQLQAVGLGDDTSQTLAAFLNAPTTSQVLAYAANDEDIEHGRCHLSVIARAALLLFISSGAARRMLRTAQYEVQDLEFWWKRYGCDRGIWDPAGLTFQQVLDMWADVDDALVTSAGMRDAAMGNISLHAWRTSAPEVSHYLGLFELVALWAVLP